MKRGALPSWVTRHPVLAGALAVALLTFALYLPSLRSGFVYDSQAQILNDSYIHNHANLLEVVTFRVMSRDVLDFNRPVQLLSLMMDSVFWGRNPFGYHLTSNLLHALNTVLVFLLIVRLAGRDDVFTLSVAALGALVFAVHPVNVEPVAEVSSREDLLATFFALLGLLLALAFARSGGRRAFWLGAGCLAALFLACGAKETGVAGPFLLAGCWVLFYRGEPWRRWAVLMAASFVVVASFLAARFAFQPGDSQIFLHPAQYLGGSPVAVVFIQPRLWAFMVKAILWPTHLSADYTPPDLAWLGLPVAMLILVVFLLVQFWLAWKSPVAALSALVFWLGLAPVSNFIPMYRPLADRFLYLPMVGVALTVAGVLLALKHGGLRNCACGFIGLALVPLAALNMQRQAVFSNSLALWRDTLVKSPHSDTAANNLGFALIDEKRYEEALVAFGNAERMTGGKKADVFFGMAIAYENLDCHVEAEAALQKAIALDPGYGNPSGLVRSLIASPAQAAILQRIKERFAD